MNIEAIKNLATNIRILSAEAVEQANSGHPGMPMGTADIAAVMWSEFLNFTPEDTEWLGRDNFVLSAGHGSALLYSLLHLFNFDLSIEEVKNFRQYGSLTPGHPEFGLTPGVEVTTGPLGQGFANGVGMALSAKMLQARYDQELFNNRVFGIVSDGDLMEGVAAEAASLAAHWKLNNLIYVYDDNDISIGGHTDICFTEDVPARFKSYGWHIAEIDGHNIEEIHSSLQEATAVKDKPVLICARTKIGFGSPNKVDTAGAHGAPLGSDELALTKEALGWEHKESFYVKDSVRSFCKEVNSKNTSMREGWEKKFASWKENKPEQAQAFQAQQSKEISSELETELFTELAKIENDATRNVSGAAIQVIAKHLSGFIGGSADLEPSNKTLIKAGGDVTAADYSERNLRFGVREHAMGSIINGLAYTKMWFPYSATFLVFADYMRPPMRLAALCHLQSLFIFTHDSYFVGEDGPTHQPIEHLSSLRVIPRLDVYRPADGIETAACYLMSLKRQDRSAAFAFTRQSLPRLERSSNFSNSDACKGGYVLSGSDIDDLVLVATGSEVSLAVDTAAKMAQNGKKARVVSIPCLEIFMEQPSSYRDQVIPKGAKKVLLEAGCSWGWGNILGSDTLFITREDYGASAPGNVLAEKFGFTPDAVSEKIDSYFG